MYENIWFVLSLILGIPINNAFLGIVFVIPGEHCNEQSYAFLSGDKFWFRGYFADLIILVAISFLLPESVYY